MGQRLVPVDFLRSGGSFRWFGLVTGAFPPERAQSRELQAACVGRRWTWTAPASSASRRGDIDERILGASRWADGGVRFSGVVF